MVYQPQRRFHCTRALTSPTRQTNSFKMLYLCFFPMPSPVIHKTENFAAPITFQHNTTKPSSNTSGFSVQRLEWQNWHFRKATLLFVQTQLISQKSWLLPAKHLWHFPPKVLYRLPGWLLGGNTQKFPAEVQCTVYIQFLPPKLHQAGVNTIILPTARNSFCSPVCLGKWT